MKFGHHQTVAGGRKTMLLMTPSVDTQGPFIIRLARRMAQMGMTDPKLRVQGAGPARWPIVRSCPS